MIRKHHCKAMGMALGAILGFELGLALDQITEGTAIGIIAGTSIGMMRDQWLRNKRDLF